MTNPDGLQFDHAEFQDDAGSPLVCSACKNSLQGQYYEVEGQTLCVQCRAHLEATLAGGSPVVRVVRAVVLGILAGTVGAGIYFAILKLTGYEIGLVAIVVGILVGGAVRMGSGERGGWLYQLLAILITYCAIVCTYIPGIVSGYQQSAESWTPSDDDLAVATKIQVFQNGEIRVNGDEIPVEQINEVLGRLDAYTTAVFYHAEDFGGSEIAQDVMDEINRRGLAVTRFEDTHFQSPVRGDDWATAIWQDGMGGKLIISLLTFAVAIAAPFLTLPGNLIGLLIIGFALHIAWKTNKRRRINITGPYVVGAGSQVTDGELRPAVDADPLTPNADNEP